MSRIVLAYAQDAAHGDATFGTARFSMAWREIEGFIERNVLRSIFGHGAPVFLPLPEGEVDARSAAGEGLQPITKS